MKISVILAHPNDGSFNHTIARTAVEQLGGNGHRVFFHDLYKEKFDPLLRSEEILKTRLCRNPFWHIAGKSPKPGESLSFIRTGGASLRLYSKAGSTE